MFHVKYSTANVLLLLERHPGRAFCWVLAAGFHAGPPLSSAGAFSGVHLKSRPGKCAAILPVDRGAGASSRHTHTLAFPPSIPLACFPLKQIHKCRPSCENIPRVFSTLFQVLHLFSFMEIQEVFGALFSFHLIQFNPLQSNSICYRDGGITLDSIFAFTVLMGQTDERFVQSILKKEAFLPTLTL